LLDSNPGKIDILARFKPRDS